MKSQLLNAMLLSLAFCFTVTPANARVALATMDGKLDELINLLANANAELVHVRESRLIDDDGQRSTQVVYTVPAGKILIVDHVTVFLDVVVGDRPTTEWRMEALLWGYAPPDGVAFISTPLGYMEELVRTSRGTPNFLMSRDVSVYFGAGDVQCVGESNFGGVDLSFGLIECTLAGRLIDAPSP